MLIGHILTMLDVAAKSLSDSHSFSTRVWLVDLQQFFDAPKGLQQPDRLQHS